MGKIKNNNFQNTTCKHTLTEFKEDYKYFQILGSAATVNWNQC